MPQNSTLPLLREIAVTGTLMAVSAVAAVLAHGYGLGTVSRPGPGGFPFLLSLGVLLSCAVALIGPLRDLLRHRAGAGNTGTDPVDLPRVLLFVGLMVAWTLVMKVAGFAIAGVLGVTAMLMLNGHRSLLRAVIFACILTAACYALFHGLLGLRL